MPEINIPTRAKVGYIETKRLDKEGKVVRARDHVVPSKGIYSTKEMEGVMRGIAKDVGADESQIRVEAYQRGEAPLEANPIHRGGPKRWEKLSDSVHEVTPRPTHQRRVWGGWTPDPSPADAECS